MSTDDPKESRSTGSSRKRNGAAGQQSNAVKASRRTRAERKPRSEPENAIREHTRPVRNPKRHNGVKKHIDEPGQSARGSTTAEAPADVSAVPAEIEKRFVRVGSEFYFPDGTRAFSDRGRKLTTPSENTEVIRSLIEIARTRGWQDIVVSGTERFRKQAWLAARAAGLSARGYHATEFEQAQAVRAKARADARAEGRAEPDAGGERTARDVSERIDRGEVRQKGWIYGRLLDHGPAHYQHDPTKQPSYFVKLETEQGERTIWGVDLDRALKQALSQPKPGDDVGLRAVRREPVTVKAPIVNGRGEHIGNEEVGRRRNRWVIERRGFLQQRATVARVFGDMNVGPSEGARRHPELLGSYLQLQSARALAEQRIRDPEDRKQFVERVRKVLAQSIARGEPLSPVRLREAPARPAEPRRRPAERDAALTH